jgi:hypothetical protein
MMKALHKVNIMKGRQLYLQKVNIHLFINLIIIHKVTLWVTNHLYKRSRWNLPIKNKMGENLVLISWVTS